jgi:hypothetical protein
VTPYPTPRPDRVHAVLMMLAAAGTVAYWVGYFASGAVRTATDPVYLGFEDAFPLADAYMSAAFVGSAILLLRGRALAVPFGIAAGGAMVFLGCMDVLFNLEHAKYRAMTAEMSIETAINVACFVFGPFTVVRLWRIRGRLAA